MSPLTVWLGTAMHTFAGDRDITIGRALGCDVRIVFRPAISRVHAVLRVQDGQWTIVDDSRHGIFVDGERVTTLAVDDDVSVTLGAPNGPRLTFRTTTHPLAIASRPILNSAAPVHRSAPPGWTQVAVPPSAAGVPRAAQPVSRVPVGAVVIGRGAGSGVVVDDPLASRTHALLIPTPTGIAIRDHGSHNGTFVNGTRISTTTLHPGDVVTVGSTDLHFTGTTLVSAPTGTRAGGLHAAALGQVVDGRTLLTDVSFTATPGTVTAVIGPSGAGKSTLIKLLAGATHPSAGRVSFDGHDVHAEYASLRSRIGMVPQDDVVHRQLTVRRALDYAAELRLPPDTTRADRAAVIARVVGELDLGDHVDTRVDNLSGGQRKRVSVAMELLTEPSLLILDEPTSGLDPALDRQVMSMLRALADAGRVVVVVTHSLTYLHMCDQVLLLAPGGKTAYVGAPVHIAATMGTTDWADIFAYVSTRPDHAHATHLARTHGDPPPVPTPPPAVAAGPPARTGDLRLTWTVARRQVRLIVSDRGYFAFLAALPFVLGALSLAVPGSTGLGLADPRSSSPNEPAQVLILLNIAAVFMGTALTIRDLVGERTIFRREQSVGLSAAAYLAAKIMVYAGAAALQTAILTTIVVAGKGGPTQGAVLLGNPVLELYVTLAATAVVSALVGLAMSAVAKSTEQILPLLVVAIMLSIVFSGGLIPVTGRAGLDQLSWLLPARWGFAASASTVDLRSVTPLVPAAERLWSHHPAWWLFDMMVLVLLGAIAAAFVRWQLRLPGYLGRAPIAPGASPSPSRPVTGAGHGSAAPPWFREIRPRQS